MDDLAGDETGDSTCVGARGKDVTALYIITT